MVLFLLDFSDVMMVGPMLVYSGMVEKAVCFAATAAFVIAGGRMRHFGTQGLDLGLVACHLQVCTCAIPNKQAQWLY